MPWSAPTYDGQKPQVEPDIYCVTIKREDSAECRCYTGQATRHEVDFNTCSHIAECNPSRKPVVDPVNQQQ